MGQLSKFCICRSFAYSLVVVFHLHDVARHFSELSEVPLLVVYEDVAADVGRLVAGHDVHQRTLA